MARTFERMQKFISERIEDPSKFEPKSFRTKKLSRGHMLMLGRPKGSKKTRAQRLLHPFPSPFVSKTQHAQILRRLQRRYRLKELPASGSKHPLWGEYVRLAHGSGRRMAKNPKRPFCIQCLEMCSRKFPICNSCLMDAAPCLNPTRTNRSHGKRRMQRRNPSSVAAPRAPEKVRKSHRDFHGYDPDTTNAIDFDLKHLEHLWELGRVYFIGYIPNDRSQHSGVVMVHYGGDQGEPGDEHKACPTCGMLLFDKNVPPEKLPHLGVSSDNRALLIVGKDLHVGPRGIRG